MKKALILSLAVLLFFACKQENLFPDYDADLPTTGAGNLPYVFMIEPAHTQQLFDDDPDTAGIQASVVVYFSNFMDEASFSGNVTIMNTTTGDMVPSIVVSYNKEAKKLYVRSEGWSSSSAYLIRLVSDGIKNRYGVALDGNHDGMNDGSPYDDFIATFYTSGSSSDSCVATTSPTVEEISPDTTRITTPRPEITINFDTEMDTTNLTDYISNFKLYKNSETGDAVPIDTVYCRPGEIRFKLKQNSDSLINGTKYFFVLNSANLKAKYLRNTPEYLLPLDGDFDGPEPTEPNFSWYFLYDTIAPPRVTNCEEIMNGVRIDFSSRMDQTILTPENIKVFDSIGYVPGSFVIVNESSDYHTTSVEYYFERTAYSPSKVFVSKNVKSTKGRMLDSNDNGIGGEDKDDCWYSL